MNLNEIPLIIPNFNQLRYLKNLVNWFKWYYPENPVIVLDNASTSAAVLAAYHLEKDIDQVIFYEVNDCAGNLKDFLSKSKFPFYIISDPDIMPHPATHPNFLEIFKAGIEAGFHHVGFDLITEDLPDWLHKKAHIIHDESMCRTKQIDFMGFKGWQGAIDTTFCLYSRANGGWSAPMNGKDWSNALRLFKAFHFKWYQHSDYLNPELDFYYQTANYRDFGAISAGKNYFRPEKYER